LRKEGGKYENKGEISRTMTVHGCEHLERGKIGEGGEERGGE
jgi:hypothetical protein